jgi:hypothetical protein
MTMPQVVNDWRDLIRAARRKLEISSFHLDRLRAELDEPGLKATELPPIPIQSHFEGVLIALMAAVDQVAAAADLALGLGSDPQHRVDNAVRQLTQRIPEVRSWFDQDIYLDLRRLRVRAVHYTYMKNPSQVLWCVESAGTRYRGSRELLEYASAGVECGRQFACLIDRIERELIAGDAMDSSGRERARR